MCDVSCRLCIIYKALWWNCDIGWSTAIDRLVFLSVCLDCPTTFLFILVTGEYAFLVVSVICMPLTGETGGFFLKMFSCREVSSLVISFL